MNEPIKNTLGVAIILTVLAVGYTGISFVSSYGKSIQPSSFRSFSVSGEGKETAIPDIAEFDFQVISQGGTDLAGVQQTNTEKTNKAIAFVKSNGVDEKDIKTAYYNVDPRYKTYNCITPPYITNGPVSADYRSIACPPPEIVGYTITQSVSVRMRDFKKIGDIMSGVVAAGANQVGSLSFTIDDRTKIEEKARAAAIVKAKAKAEEVARAGGFSLGRLLGIQEGGYGGYPMYDSYKTMGMGVGSASSVVPPAPAIQPGSQDVSVNVTLQYEIQ